MLKLPKHVAPLLEAGILYRNKMDLNRSLFSFWKAWCIWRGIIPTEDLGATDTLIEPEFSESWSAVESLRQVTKFAETELRWNPGIKVDIYFLLQISSCAATMYFGLPQGGNISGTTIGADRAAAGGGYAGANSGAGPMGMGAQPGVFNSPLDGLSLRLVYQCSRLSKGTPMESGVNRCLATILFRFGEYSLAAPLWLHIVKEIEGRCGDCSLDLACQYNNLAVAYMMLNEPGEDGGGPRNREALAYLTLSMKMISLYLPYSHLRVEAVSRNLERCRVADRGRRWESRPYLWYLSLEGKAKVGGGKKKGKKKK